MFHYSRGMFLRIVGGYKIIQNIEIINPKPFGAILYCLLKTCLSHEWFDQRLLHDAVNCVLTGISTKNSNFFKRYF